MLLKLIGFKGELPSVQPRSLPDVYAKFAFDTKLNDGSLKSFRKSRFITALTAGTDYKTINLYGATWRGWDADVDAVINIVTNPAMKYGLKGTVNVMALPVGSDTYMARANASLDYGLEKISYYVAATGMLQNFDITH